MRSSCRSHLQQHKIGVTYSNTKLVVVLAVSQPVPWLADPVSRACMTSAILAWPVLMSHHSFPCSLQATQELAKLALENNVEHTLPFEMTLSSPPPPPPTLCSCRITDPLLSALSLKWGLSKLPLTATEDASCLWRRGARQVVVVQVG